VQLYINKEINWQKTYVSFIKTLLRQLLANEHSTQWVRGLRFWVCRVRPICYFDASKIASLVGADPFLTHLAMNRSAYNVYIVCYVLWCLTQGIRKRIYSMLRFILMLAWGLPLGLCLELLWPSMGMVRHEWRKAVDLLSYQRV
jgi:hypothetical protein